MRRWYEGIDSEQDQQARRLQDMRERRRVRYASAYDVVAATLVPPRGVSGEWRLVLTRVLERRVCGW